MKKPNKTHLLLITAIICLILLVIYLGILDHFKNLQDTVTSYFTALGALSGFATLVIAILLYNKFKLDSQFLYLQAKEIIKLHNALTRENILLQYKNGRFFLRAAATSFFDENSDEIFKKVLDKYIAFNDEEIDNWMKKLYKFKESTLLPIEIKSKLDFIFFWGSNPITDDLNEYVILRFSRQKFDNYSVMLPSITVKDFVQSYIELGDAINNWFENNTSVQIQLKTYYSYK